MSRARLVDSAAHIRRVHTTSGHVWTSFAESASGNVYRRRSAVLHRPRDHRHERAYSKELWLLCGASIFRGNIADHGAILCYFSVDARRLVHFTTLLSVLAGLRELKFHLIWWGFVFPNVGFTISTASIGTALKSEGILWVASAMTILIVAVWLLVLAFHIKAVLTKRIMMPGVDEDSSKLVPLARVHELT